MATTQADQTVIVTQEIANQKLDIRLFLWRVLDVGVRALGFVFCVLVHHGVGWILKHFLSTNAQFLTLVLGVLDVAFIVVFVDMVVEMVLVFIPSVKGWIHDRLHRNKAKAEGPTA